MKQSPMPATTHRCTETTTPTPFTLSFSGVVESFSTVIVATGFDSAHESWLSPGLQNEGARGGVHMVGFNNGRWEQNGSTSVLAWVHLLGQSSHRSMLVFVTLIEDVMDRRYSFHGTVSNREFPIACNIQNEIFLAYCRMSRT